MRKLTPIQHSALKNSPHELIFLNDSNGVLALRLESIKGESIDICFDGYVFYSKIDEGDALRTLGLLRKSSCIGHTLISTPDSDLLDWFNKESLGIRPKNQLSHHIILTENDIVNVISVDTPSITVV